MINPRLRELLDSNRFDWDDLRHRVMYLREWAAKGTEAFRADPEPAPGDPAPVTTALEKPVDP